MRLAIAAFAGLLVLAAPASSLAQVTSDVPLVRPDAIVNLASDDGVAAVKAQWRYSDARIVEVEHRSPGPVEGHTRLRRILPGS